MLSVQLLVARKTELIQPVNSPIDDYSPQCPLQQKQKMAAIAFSSPIHVVKYPPWCPKLKYREPVVDLGGSVLSSPMPLATQCFFPLVWRSIKIRPIPCFLNQ
ncbi:hypothetical protein CsSME_00025764 [Camellia sinensis var. sinensis]